MRIQELTMGQRFPQGPVSLDTAGAADEGDRRHFRWTGIRGDFTLGKRVLILLLTSLALACATTDSEDLPPQQNTADVEGTSDVSPTAEVEATVVVPRATCDAPIGGDVFLSPETAFEAIPGFDDDLALQDIDGLPETIDLASIGILQRSLVAYMLEIPLDDLPDALSREEIASHEPMGAAVLGAFAEAATKGFPGVDLPFLRRGLHRFYQCDRQWPLTLEDFRAAIYDYADLPGYEVHSIPKDEARRLREDHQAKVYVGETLVDGEVVETEILLGANRDDGALDFIAYDASGALVDRGAFVVTTGDKIGVAAPYGCISCHFEDGTFRINVVFPDMAPVAPQED